MCDTVVMDFTHAYDTEDFPEDSHLVWTDCTEIIGTNAYCDLEAQTALSRLIAPYKSARIHYIDTGNYHYLSLLWARQLEQPYSLVVLDHHPDMQPPQFEGVLSCGGWVRTLLEECPLLQRVYIIGASRALREEADAFKDRVTYVTEEEAASYPEPGHPYFPMKEERVYLSIDLDVLSTAEVHTNWDQGSMTAAQLLHLLDLIFEETKVLGVDVCGGDSELTAPQKAQNRELNKALYNYLISHIYGIQQID